MRGKLRAATIAGVVFIMAASAMAAKKKRSRARPEARPEATKAAPDTRAKTGQPAGLGGATAALGQPGTAAGRPGGQPVVVECKAPAVAPVRPAAPPAAAGGKGRKKLWDWGKLGHDLVLTLIYALMGLVIALFGYQVYHWITPFDLRKELEEDQNTSLGIVAGAIILGLCIIVAAAILSP